MATDAAVSKPPLKWLTNKAFKLTFPRLRSKSKPPTTASPPGNKHEQLRRVFRFFDGDGDGKISTDELRSAFESIGESLSGDKARRVIVDFDADGDGFLEFDDFVRLVERDGDGVEDDLRRAYEMFEGGDGCITPKGLQRVLGRLGETASYEQCVAMIRVFDLDGNGVLDFYEFHKMMT